MTLVYNSLPHPTSVGGVFFQLFILRYHENCVSLHPDNTKRKEIIMLREPIIIKNPSPKALEMIERMKEDKRRIRETMRKNREWAIQIR